MVGLFFLSFNKTSVLISKSIKVPKTVRLLVLKVVLNFIIFKKKIGLVYNDTV